MVKQRPQVYEPMSLVYDSRRATRDIDAVFHPHGVVLEEAHSVAEELGLPQWWLNPLVTVPLGRGMRADGDCHRPPLPRRRWAGSAAA